jgi:hypothetical protein
MQLKFSNGTTLDVLAVKGNPTYFQGAQRDALEIQIGKSKTTFDALDKLTGDPDKTGKLTILDGDKQYQHDNYSLRTELALKPVVTAEATSTTPEQTEDRFCVTLAQKTYAELQVEELQSSVDALTLSTLGAK